MPRLRQRRLAVIAGPPLIVLVLALLALGASRRVSAARAALTRSHAIADAADGVLSTFLEAESGQRGFLITGDTSYLRPYVAASRTARVRLDSLRALVRDDPVQRADVDSLARLSSQKLDELAATIRLRQERGEAAARTVVATGRGLRLTDDARGLVTRITRRELRREAVDEARDATRMRLTMLALAAGVALAVVLALLVNLLLAREGQRHARALAERALLLETMPQLVWSTTPEGFHDYYNSRWYAYTGMPRDGAQGWNWKAFLHPDDYERTMALWHHSLATGEPYEVEYRFREAATGRWRWFLGRAQPLCDDQGRIVRWFGTCTDIDRAKRAEDGAHFLAEASAVLAASLDWQATLAAVARLAVPRLADWCAVWVQDEGTAPRQIALAHRDPEREARGATIVRGARVNPEVGVGRTLRTGEPQVMPVLDDAALERGVPDPAVRTALRELGLRAQAVFPLFADGRTVGALQLVMAESGRGLDEDDVVLAAELAHRASLAIERARLYQEATAARVEAERANRAKSEFLATMSHELRTPLNAITGYTDLMLLGLRGPLGDLQQDDLRRVQRASQHLLALINDVLNYARLEAGSVEVRAADVPLDETLESLEALLSPQLAARGLHFVATTCEGPLLVRADPEKLRQILVNLLGNAIKFTEPGGDVSLHCEAGSATVCITVRDTGRGIPAERLAEIFDPFVQVDRHRTAESQQGVGLGLAISRDLARLMGGDITVRSEPGRGSEFVLVLPRAFASPVARSA